MSILNYIAPQKILFIDIETASISRSFEDLDPEMQALWARKAAHITRNYDTPIEQNVLESTYRDKAGIHAEFAKVICVGLGFFTDLETEKAIRIKTIHEGDEEEILTQFAAFVNQYVSTKGFRFYCGHNIKEFDAPFLCRRLLINGIGLPPSLDLSGKRPWEVRHLLDTLQFWKFGDYKKYTSLKLLAKIFGIPAPKEDLEGNQVGSVYWEEQDFERISKYCAKDVLTTMQLFNKYTGQNLVEPENVEYV